MERLTLAQMQDLTLGTVLRVIWRDAREYYGTVFGDKLGYEDGKTDDLKVIREAMNDDCCMVYRMF